jgi:3-oxoacyl-[acyl-carrier protein] reductase
MLATHGARVAVVDLRQEAVERTIEQVNRPDRQRAIGAACDVRVAADCERAVALTQEQFGGVDALVHCAGILRPPGGRPRPMHELEDDEYTAVVDTNLKGTFLMNRAALRSMVPQRAGQIVNVSSTSGRKGRPLDSVYSASKAGVIALTKSLGKELATENIAVNCITPAAARTRIFDQLSQSHIDFMLSKIPRGRFVTPDEIAALIAWVASEDNSFTTGAVFDISGGRATY